MLSHNSNLKLNPLKNKAFTPNHPLKHDKNSFGWSWLDRWMANKPWESRFMENVPNEFSFSSPLSKISSVHSKFTSRRNQPNFARRVTQSSPDLNSKLLIEDTSTSTSSISASNTRSSSSTEKTDESGSSKPWYVSLTKSNKAKQLGNNISLHGSKRHSLQEIQNHPFSLTRTRISGDARSSADSASVPYSAPICQDLYPPFLVDRYDWKYR